MHPVYMGDSLGEGYFGMEDLLGGGHSDEGEEFRNSLAHLQNSKFGGDPEGRGDQQVVGTDERSADEAGKIEKGPGLTINNLAAITRRAGDETTRGFPAPPPEDQGLISPGDLDHEFLLLRKKKFTGINIVQVFPPSLP